MNYYFSILFLLTISLGINGFGQENYKLKVTSDLNEELTYDSIHSDSVSLISEIERNLVLLQSKGYITSYYELNNQGDNLYVCDFYSGDQYYWGQLKIAPLIRQINGNVNEKKLKLINKQSVVELVNNVLEKCQNTGFPFAQVFFDSVEINNSKVNAKLTLDLNDFIIIDSVVVKGGLKTSLNYVEKQIGISKGSVYNEKAIKSINKIIQNITFVETIRSPEVYFTKGKATLVLYLKDKTASKFDGILGLNPDELTGKIGVIGELKVDLLNVFKRGENIILNWEQAKSKSQNYIFRYNHPFLFNSNIGLTTGLKYFRQDTSFANLNADFGFNYFLNEKQKIGLSAQIIKSNSLLNSHDLLSDIPTVNSVTTIYYGINYSYNSLDYKFNPRSGIDITSSLHSGNKSIIKNHDIENNSYNELEEKVVQLKIDMEIKYYIPILKRSTLLLKMQAGNIFGDNIFINELYQIGGLKNLRGFNQQSILVSNYYIATSEFRYLYAKNSSVFSFIDYAYIENRSIKTFESDTPFSFGLGTNFQTNSGIFSLSYGLGKQNGNPILFKNGKIHFGFVSLF